MSNIILIGMPGAGKSTLGVQLAKETARDFIDTDVLIQLREGQTLQQIMDGANYLKLRRIEEQVLLALDCGHHVIATGGSVIYSEAGMAKLKELGPIVFLDASLEELHKRIDNYESRGVARRPDQSFQALYDERFSLYIEYADIILNCNDRSQSSLMKELIKELADESSSD